MFPAGLTRTFGFGNRTAAPGVFNVIVPPRKATAANGLRTKITKLVYTAGTTAHTLTCLRPIGKTWAVGLGTSGQNQVVLAADPGAWSGKATAPHPIAVNDWVVVQYPDSTLKDFTVSAVTPGASGAGPTITLSGNLAVNLQLPTTQNNGVIVATSQGGVVPGSQIWLYGVAATVDPNSGVAHETVTAPSSTTTTLLADGGGSVFESNGEYEPLLMQSNNLTAAGTFNLLSGVYGP